MNRNEAREVGKDTRRLCWLCSSDDLRCILPARLPEKLESAAFRVTDANYGWSAAIYQCGRCGFRECPDFTDVLAFYEGMDDAGYEESRAPRMLQAARLLGHLKMPRPRARLLDIGAGSGIMVEAAARAGYLAEGVEPSRWMVDRALERGLPVHCGVLPMPEVAGPFDVVTLVDVIEHVPDPVGLLRSARDVMAPDGIGLVVTPDVSSVAARLMRRRWWHYRLAHIGYFERRTLIDALGRAGLVPVSVFRPAWFFNADYLIQRLGQYIPPLRRVRSPILERTIIPLNLFDSLAVVFRRGA
jgi:SAM-dependent methyltransferase